MEEFTSPPLMVVQSGRRDTYGFYSMFQEMIERCGEGSMAMNTIALSLDQLWQEVGFEPNTNQREAILHVDSPLYLPAGPGSGKTRVLLWRTLNLCVFHGVRPEEIYLSTFTEKAAHQLKEGLRALFGIVTNHTGVPYDLSQRYIGT